MSSSASSTSGLTPLDQEQDRILSGHVEMVNGNRVMDGGPSSAFDKVPLRFTDGDTAEYANLGARVVPGALVRRGAHIAKDAVLMPSYTNIGAFVGAGASLRAHTVVGDGGRVPAGAVLSDARVAAD